MSDRNLFLHFMFTDRGGRDVFEIHRADDAMALKSPLGTVRLPTVSDHRPEVKWLADEVVAEPAMPEQGELDLDNGPTKNGGAA